MNVLITLQTAPIGTATVQTCNARDLHEFLEVETRFNDWIVRRIEEYEFEEGKDFCYSNLSSKNEGSGGHNRKEYFLSLDMAKELSMVERTEKGKQARQYFIECERRAKASGQVKPLPPTKQAKEALKVMDTAVRFLQRWGFDQNASLISANQYTRKHAQIDVLADTGNTHLTAENQTSLYYTPTELGQQLNGISARRVNTWLEETGLQSKQTGQWQPTATGMKHARLFDTAKRHTNGAPIQQVKWADSVIPLLQVA